MLSYTQRLTLHHMRTMLLSYFFYYVNWDEVFISISFTVEAVDGLASYALVVSGVSGAFVTAEALVVGAEDGDCFHVIVLLVICR